MPNILLLHYQDLKRDLEGEMRRIAAFLGRDIAPGRWPDMVEHCTFDYMQQHAKGVAPPGAELMTGGARSFINKGETGRWRDLLTAGDIAAYERAAVVQLGEECARWLASGSIAAGSA